MLIEGGVEDSRHAISGQIARELFGGGASEARPSVEGRQPEPAASVVGGGPGRDGPRLGGEDRRRRSAAWTGRRCATGFIASTPRAGEGLIDNWTAGPKPRLSEQQLAQFAQIVEAGPDREKDGVVRWRRIDLKRVIAERFGGGLSEILCAGPGFHQVLTKRSPNMMANWVLASAHSRGGIFHC